MSIIPAEPPAQEQDPEKQMAEFLAQRGPQAPAQPAQETSAAAATQQPAATTTETASSDPWDQIADDDDLPPSAKGKTRREVWDMLKPALPQLHQMGFQKNRLEADLAVERATNAALLRRFQETAAPVPQQRPYQRAGINDPGQALLDPTAAAGSFDQLASYAEQVAAQVGEQIRQQEVEPLRNGLLKIQGDAAMERARAAMNIAPQTWKNIERNLAAIMFTNGGDVTNEGHWMWAAQEYQKHAAALLPQPRATVAAPLAVGNGRPAAAAGPATVKAAKSTGNKHLDASIENHLAIWNEDALKRGGKPMSRDEFMDFIGADLNPFGFRE